MELTNGTVEVIAGRDAEGTGGAGRLGRTRQDDKQRKLVLEGKEGEK